MNVTWKSYKKTSKNRVKNIEIVSYWKTFKDFWKKKVFMQVTGELKHVLEMTPGLLPFFLDVLLFYWQQFCPCWLQSFQQYTLRVPASWLTLRLTINNLLQHEPIFIETDHLAVWARTHTFAPNQFVNRCKNRGQI